VALRSSAISRTISAGAATALPITADSAVAGVATLTDRHCRCLGAVSVPFEWPASTAFLSSVTSSSRWFVRPRVLSIQEGAVVHYLHHRRIGSVYLEAAFDADIIL
jgi:hypothetical protein